MVHGTHVAVVPSEMKNRSGEHRRLKYTLTVRSDVAWLKVNMHHRILLQKILSWRLVDAGPKPHRGIF